LPPRRRKLAKSKKTETEQGNMRSIFSKYTKEKGKNKFELFDESEFTEIPGYISTGCHSLNSIISGDVYKGIAKRRITAFAGKPGVGKTYFITNLIREAQKEGIGVIFFETEGAVTKDGFENLGVDTEQILFQSATTIAQWQVDVCQVLQDLHEEYPDKEWLVVTDSIANLTTEKEENDTYTKGTPKSDQGARAKQLKAASRLIQKAVGTCNATLVVTNHTYEKPPPYPNMPTEEVFSGGSGFIFMCSTIIMLTKKLDEEKEKNAETGKEEKTAVSAVLRAETTKNRLVPEGKRANILLNFEKGLHPYYGLLKYALDGKLLKKSGGWWTLPDGSKVQGDDKIYSKEVFGVILDEVNEYIKNKFSYSKFQDEEVIKEIEEVVETMEDEVESPESVDED
jgi:RecA/RadA recombinase